MIATNSPPSVVAVQDPIATNPFNGTKFLKVGTVADFLGVSASQCRLLASRGELSTETTIGGHRRFLTQSVLTYAYGDTPDPETGNEDTPTAKKRVIGMCRVSSRKQATKQGSSDASSLEHQEQRIRDYLTQEKKLGGGDDYEVEFIHSVGSGLNYERKELLDLVRRMVSGELRGCRLILTTKDRLVRFGWELMNFLANYGGVTIEYCCSDEEQDENETLAMDVISVMQHACAVVSGNKARKILKVTLDPQSLQTAYRMKKAGRSYRYIAEHFKSRNVTDDKGRIYSATIIRKNLCENWKVLEAI